MFQVFAMGQKHSKRPKKLKSQPEVTEIIELNDNQSELDDDGRIVSEASKPSEHIVYPAELKKVMETVESIEKSIEDMSGSQIDLYYATLKDELHNNWQRLYDISDHGDDAVRSGKIETIERVKNNLKRLNRKVLMKRHAVDN
ncbi:hypothetical protein MTP99_007058 [Tenebrio molitor]|jgi:hypothetical protein|nr:hypothetical protein MTP99_007058 [Tenebrio molitor]